MDRREVLELQCKGRGIEVPQEFYDVIKVLIFGVDKGYAPNGWLNGVQFDHKKNHDSMFHHLAESFNGQPYDKESGLDPKLHLACRALMEYTVQLRTQKQYEDSCDGGGLF